MLRHATRTNLMSLILSAQKGNSRTIYIRRSEQHFVIQ